MKLTEEERDEMNTLTTDELRIMVEGAVRKRKKVRIDKAAYSKACNDIIKLQEARMEYAVDVLESRDSKPAVPPSLPTGASVKPPPPPSAH